ncbi:hypothetical protein QOZ80_4BG0359520 [Eleusine coracana subsp. coracana]|nr:hypothetical protein QOZ80_4BG0359520 [Eleusine coracana subsp. coracana]
MSREFDYFLIRSYKSAKAAAAFRIPQPPPAFGVRRVTAEQCLHNLDFLRGEAPFFLGTAAAIHIGSTNSCIAGYYADGEGAYRFCIPFSEGSGEAARNNHAAIRPLRSGSFQAHQAQAFSTQYVAGTLISELKHMAEAHLGREIEYAVLTVPRHVTYAGRQSLRYAGMVLGGFRSVKVVDEQIAAAAAHGHHLQPGDGKVVLVFHVGGRTTHATIFKFINGMPWLVHHLVELVKQQHGTDIRHDKAALLKLKAERERAKKTLSDQEQTIVQVELLTPSSRS